MSKNFEQAYKELAQIEVPDLWDRIEAGLTSKSAPENSDINLDASKDIDVIGNIKRNTNIEVHAVTEINIDSDINTDTDIYANTKKMAPNKIWRLTGKYAGAIAAILCVAVLLPTAALIKRAEDKSFSGAAMEGIDTAQATEESAADMAIPENEAQTEDAAMPEEASAGAGAVEDDRSADSGADSAAAKNAQVSMADTWSEAEADEEAEMSVNGGSANFDGDDLSSQESDVERKQKSESREEKKIEEMGEAISEGAITLPEGTLLEEIVIEVRSVSDDINRDSRAGTLGSVYTVVVKEDASGRLAKDSELEVFVPAHASFALLVGGTYVIDIAYTKEEEYPVVQRSEKAEK